MHILTDRLERRAVALKNDDSAKTGKSMHLKVSAFQGRFLQRSADRRARGAGPEVRGLRCEAGGPGFEARGARPEVRGPRCEARGAMPEMRGPRCEALGARPEVRSPGP